MPDQDKLVILYTQPECQGCRMTKKYFTEHGVAHEVYDVSEPENQKGYNKVKKLGYSSAPVVIIKKNGRRVDHWTGYSITKIQAHFPKSEYPRLPKEQRA
ncbi:thioredoxin domain [Gordonia phage Yvonnetastic]|uniref:Glutaredoxin n=1 Tax=Gordonia phage Yvonnetastic TaxID=1821566 RepID=A0A142K990_9CAUD|nr:thioredoxin domain [Gordonia phage Yvonnetastic]AMS02673.1 glutaredoxin [Gordonia phage Yvonnetastic]WKW86107.1 NrdH-like glutaredoxin [Gordonia Phage JonJames]